MHDSLEASLASYHSQVSELAEELLVAHSYFESNPNYWVDSGLVSDSDAETCVFEAAKAACILQEGLSPQDTASKLFYAHLAFVQAFRQRILSSNFDDPLTFDECHCQIFAEAQPPAESQSKSKKEGQGCSLRSVSVFLCLDIFLVLYLLSSVSR